MGCLIDQMRPMRNDADTPSAVALTKRSAIVDAAGRCASPSLLAALSVALLALDWLIFVRPGVTYAAVAPNDFLLFADLSHRFAQGQVPHVDFHTPLGWLSMWLLRAGFLLQEGFAGAPEAADMLMLAMLLPLACAVLAGRVPTGAAAAILGAVFGMTVAPWWLGSTGWSTDPGLHYNHWGWSLLTVLLLVGLPGGGQWRWLADGAVVGALLSLLFFVKITYWAAGMGFVVLFGVALGGFRRAAVLGLSLFAACVLSVQAAGGWIDDYIRDVLAAVDTARGPLLEGTYRPLSVIDVLHGARADAALAVLAGTAALFWGHLSRQTALHCAFTLAACIAVLVQNTQTPNLMGALPAFLVRLAVEAPIGSGTRRLSWVALALHLAPAFARQAMAMATFVAAMIGGGGGVWLPAALPRMDGVWFGQESSRSVNAIAEQAHWQSLDDAFVWGRSHRGRLHNSHLSSAEYRESLQSGVKLLRGAGADKGRVANLDFNNPFPVLLDAPPPKGVLFCLHVNRHLGPGNAGDAGLILGDAQWLMIPTLPYMQETTALLLGTLAAHLDAHWAPAASNDLWTLLRRGDEA